jgi:hypothetical protein
MCSSIYGSLKKDKSGKANKYRSVGTGNPHHPVHRRPAQETITRSFLNPAMPGERLFAPQCL